MFRYNQVDKQDAAYNRQAFTHTGAEGDCINHGINSSKSKVLSFAQQYHYWPHISDRSNVSSSGILPCPLPL